MGFKRAQWHSGLTYQRTCDTCKTVLQYTDYSLDFRPWYADGFVDCPKCKTHLRHNESYAIDRKAPEMQAVAPPAQPADQQPVQETPAYAVDLADQQPAQEIPVYAQPAEDTPAYAVDLADQKSPAAMPAFCSACGNRYGENDRFCPQCGNKR